MFRALWGAGTIQVYRCLEYVAYQREEGKPAELNCTILAFLRMNFLFQPWRLRKEMSAAPTAATWGGLVGNNKFLSQPNPFAILRRQK